MFGVPEARVIVLALAEPTSVSIEVALALQLLLLILGAGASWGIAQSRLKEARALATAAAHDARDAKTTLERRIEQATAPLVAQLGEHRAKIAVLEADVKHGSERLSEALSRIEGQVSAVHRRLDALMERLFQGGSA